MPPHSPTGYPFSRNGEEAADEAPWYATPICSVEDGRVFCKWNRNRIENAQKLDGVPRLTALQREAMEYFDAVLRRPENMFCMYLAPGDLQILCNQTMLHSRTNFEDHADADKKRTLYRLWLARPDSRRLPESWAVYLRHHRARHGARRHEGPSLRRCAAPVRRPPGGGGRHEGGLACDRDWPHPSRRIASRCSSG